MGDLMQVNRENVEGHFVLGTAFSFKKKIPVPPLCFACLLSLLSCHFLLFY
jgi:hypothetical protein